MWKNYYIDYNGDVVETTETNHSEPPSGDWVIVFESPDLVILEWHGEILDGYDHFIFSVRQT